MPHNPEIIDKDAVTGQLYNNQQTVGQNSKDDANRWHQFFGPPAGEIRTNPYDKYQYETYTMPDAYVGKNIYIRDTIEGFIEGSNNWYTTAALPIRVTDQIHLSWNEWHFASVCTPPFYTTASYAALLHTGPSAGLRRARGGHLPADHQLEARAGGSHHPPRPGVCTRARV